MVKLFARVGMEIELTEQELEIIKKGQEVDVTGDTLEVSRETLLEMWEIMNRVLADGRMTLAEESYVPNAQEQLGEDSMNYFDDELLLC